MTARMAAELLSPPHLAIAAFAATPDPGLAGVQVWSTVDAVLLTWDGSEWIAGSSSGAAPYDVHAFCPGAPTASALLIRIAVARAVNFAADFAGSYGVAGTAATGSTVFDVQKNGSSIGSIAFAAAATTATFTTSGGTAQTLAAGDVLAIIAPAPPDATLADVGFALAGTR